MPATDAQSANLTPPIDDLLKVQLVEGEGAEPPLFEHSTPPTTTAEQNLRTKGQRLINFIWETSQMIIDLYRRFNCFARCRNYDKPDGRIDAAECNERNHHRVLF
jgi:hypothetical protein